MKKLFQVGMINVLIGMVFLIGYWIIRTNHDTIEFEDENLEQHIRELIGVETGPIRRSTLRGVTVLEAVDLDIHSLEGIQGMVNLRVVNLEDNAIRDVRPLASLRYLTELSLRNNGIINLAAIHFQALHDLPELRVLSLRHNVIRFEDADVSQMRLSDLSLLAGLEALEVLELRDNHIEDLSPLANLHRLQRLDISGNFIDSDQLHVFQNHPDLVHLNLRETWVDDLSLLASLQSLRYLNLHSNHQIITLEPLQSLVELETLILRNVPIGTDIIYLEKMENLRRLNVRNTGLNDLTVIADLMRRGALLDTEQSDAIVDLRDNPITMDENGYPLMTPYWPQISYAYPERLPVSATQTVFINEMMSSNGQSIIDETGAHPDWIELYNPHETPFDISGYYLSDNSTNVTKWRFPEGTIIPAKGFLIVFASGKDIVASNGMIHTNFKLSASGELLYLISPDGAFLVDYFPPVALPRDVSYGRFPDGGAQLVYFPLRETSPGSSNNDSSYQTSP